MFKDWVTSRNLDVVEKCPIDLLKNEDNGVDTLDIWLAMFVLEVWKSDGTYYSPTSLKGLLAGIQRYMKEKGPVSVPKMLSRNDSSFVKLMNALDRQLRLLRSAGIVPNQSEVFTKDLEQKEKITTPISSMTFNDCVSITVHSHVIPLLVENWNTRKSKAIVTMSMTTFFLKKTLFCLRTLHEVLPGIK